MTTTIQPKNPKTRATGKKRVLKTPENKRTERLNCYITPNEMKILLGEGLHANRHFKALVTREIERLEQEARRKAHLKEAARIRSQQVADTVKPVGGEWD